MERAFRWCGVRARETILAAADESLPMWSRGRATMHEKVNEKKKERRKQKSGDSVCKKKKEEVK